MPAYPENVRSPAQTGSRRDPVKPARMTKADLGLAGWIGPEVGLAHQVLEITLG